MSPALKMAICIWYEVEYVISCVTQTINTAPSRKISITPVKTGRR